MILLDLTVLYPYLQLLFYAMISIGLIFFITYGIVKNNANYITRGFVFILVGSFLVILFILACIIDYSSSLVANFGIFGYLVFICASIFYTLVLGLTNVIRGKNRYQKLNLRKTAPSVNRNIQQHIYVVYKYQNKIILHKEKDKISGFVLSMNKSHMFKDELLNTLNTKYKVKPLYDDLKELGVCTISGKKPNVYYCFLVEIDDIPAELLTEAIIDQYEIVTIELSENDKQMILRILMREEFKIYL